MAVILKKDEKVKAVIENLNTNYNVEDFIAKFQELYPKDWNKISLNYRKTFENTKQGKIIPMPKPEQYLKNALNVYIKKNK
jgi:hypothetical protein